MSRNSSFGGITSGECPDNGWCVLKPRVKSEHTPEEWAERLRRQKVASDKWRAKPESREMLKLYGAEYRSRPGVKERRRETWRAWSKKNADHLRAKELKRYSGMTISLADELLVQQHNACAVCCRSFTESRPPKADHCHDRNIPRGMLCFECNIAEGIIKNIGLCAKEFGERLADYLLNPPAQKIKNDKQ